MQKPSNAKGTRDFGPEVVQKRTYILNTIKEVFELYGFAPLQTPALENLTTLTGKYGDEGDKLLFKVLDSGDVVKKVNQNDLASEDNAAFIGSIASKGLRYDLTVPFARFVVQHRNDLTFPFRRYQIQEVWRADKPQKGRYREFTQCDADVIGSTSMVNEADLIGIYNEVFHKLGLSNAILKLNHRKLLEGLVDELKLDFPVTKFTSTLDKLDKIGEEGVKEEFINLGIDSNKIDQLFTIIGQFQLNKESLNTIASAFNQNAIALEAVNDLEKVLSYVEANGGVNIDIQLDLSLARGLDYYTGCIFEALIPDSGIGSVSGGGRYDDLTSVFGLKDVSGVGISFGIDRLYDIMEAQNLFPEDRIKAKQILVCHFDEESMLYGAGVASALRNAGISAVVFPEQRNIKKQFNYADKANFDICIVIGGEEMESGNLSVKDLKNGENSKMTVQSLIDSLS